MSSVTSLSQSHSQKAWNTSCVGCPNVIAGALAAIGSCAILGGIIGAVVTGSPIGMYVTAGGGSMLFLAVLQVLCCAKSFQSYDHLYRR